MEFEISQLVEWVILPILMYAAKMTRDIRDSSQVTSIAVAEMAVELGHTTDHVKENEAKIQRIGETLNEHHVRIHDLEGATRPAA